MAIAKYLGKPLSLPPEQQKQFIDKLTQQTLEHEVLIAQLTENLVTPLQIISHFNRALEIGFNAGVKPISKEIIDQVLVPHGSIVELQYARSGYRTSTLAKILHTTEKEINQWFLGKLSEMRVTEIQEALAQANVIV